MYRYNLYRFRRRACKHDLCEKPSHVELVFLWVTYPAVSAVDGKAPLCPLGTWAKLVYALAVCAGERVATYHAAAAIVAGVAGAAVPQVRVERVVRVVSADHRPVPEPLQRWGRERERGREGDGEQNNNTITRHRHGHRHNQNQNHNQNVRARRRR